MVTAAHNFAKFIIFITWLSAVIGVVLVYRIYPVFSVFCGVCVALNILFTAYGDLKGDKNNEEREE